jgi:biopolymer transport protein TolR
MPRRAPLTTMRQISEINMTPLMDLTFILLITFIITFPLIEQGVPMDLPKGEADALDEDRARSISVDNEGQVYLDDTPIAMDVLAREMATLGRADPNAVVLVRADQTLAYGRVMEIVQMLHQSKIARMALVTSPEKQ